MSKPIARDVPQRGSVTVTRFAHADRAAPHHTPVTHSHAVLAFYTGGRLRMEQNGQWTIRPGDVVLVPPGEPHRMLEAKGATCWGLNFCVSCFAANGSASLLAPFERVRDGGAAVVRIPPARRAYVETLFRELETSASDSEALDPVQRSLLTLILAEVERASVATPSKHAPGVVADALRYIERNCLGAITLKQIAAAVGRSPAYVTTALTKATGRSAGEWIVAGRMAEARRLLLHSDERIEIVAERVGYADATHFIRMFRREHGMTPTAWRRGDVTVGRPARAPSSARR